MRLAFLSFLVLGAAASDPARPSLRVATTTADIRIDGRLDEAAWVSADSSSAFLQVEPDEGAESTNRTVVRAIASRDALVFAIRCDYSPGVNIVTFARERDAALTNEDHALARSSDGRESSVSDVITESKAT